MSEHTGDFALYLYCTSEPGWPSSGHDKRLMPEHFQMPLRIPLFEQIGMTLPLLSVNLII